LFWALEPLPAIAERSRLSLGRVKAFLSFVSLGIVALGLCSCCALFSGGISIDYYLAPAPLEHHAVLLRRFLHRYESVDDVVAHSLGRAHEGIAEASAALRHEFEDIAFFDFRELVERELSACAVAADDAHDRQRPRLTAEKAEGARLLEHARADRDALHVRRLYAPAQHRAGTAAPLAGASGVGRQLVFEETVGVCKLEDLRIGRARSAHVAHRAGMVPAIISFRGARAAFAVVMRAYEPAAGARIGSRAHRGAAPAPAGLGLRRNRLGERDPDRFGDRRAGNERRRRRRRRRAAVDDRPFRRDDANR